MHGLQKYKSFVTECAFLKGFILLLYTARPLFLFMKQNATENCTLELLRFFRYNNANTSALSVLNAANLKSSNPCGLNWLVEREM